MNSLIYHIASGQAFFSGVTLIIVAAMASTRGTRLARRVAVLGFVIGIIAVAISSTAIPYWCYGLAGVVTGAWLASRFVERWRRWTPIAVGVAWAIAAAVELPYHVMPSLEPAASRSVTVIGDSVTAGMGSSDQSIRWPMLLAEEHDLDIQDLSYPGATVATALRRAQSPPITSSVVLLEIGGNDLLGDTTSAQFARDLDALLAHISAPGRQTIMLELPLPPFRHEFGRIQRALARQYHVALVPKRVFLSVLTASDATVDTIHLSQTGHQHMAERMWEVLRTAFSTTRTVKRGDASS